MRKSPLCALLVSLLCAAGMPAQQGGSPPPALARLRARLEAVLDAMDKDAARVAEELGKSGLMGPGTGDRLRRLCASHKGAVDCTAVDAKGIMRIVEPPAFAKHQGADIGGQEQIGRLRETRKPTLSLAFMSVEGIEAVDLEWPVLGERGDLLGSVSVLFRPDELIGEAFGQAAQAAGCDAWVAQTDGRVLYGPGAGCVGKSLITDQPYASSPTLAALARRMAEEPGGDGSFELGNAGPARRASWTTVDLHGTAWRILVAQEAPGKTAQAAPRRPSVSS